MATPRSNTPRASRVAYRGAQYVPVPLSQREVEDVADPTAPRRLVDHALARRAAIVSIYRSGGLSSDHLDADPYLLRAAKFHGEPSGRQCPICRKADVDLVTYTYGDELGYASGRVHTSTELMEMAHEFGEFNVYVVEVCQACSWNHLLMTYVLGDGVPRRPPARPADLLDD